MVFELIGLHLLQPLHGLSFRLHCFVGALTLGYYLNKVKLSCFSYNHKVGKIAKIGLLGVVMTERTRVGVGGMEAMITRRATTLLWEEI